MGIVDGDREAVYDCNKGWTRAWHSMFSAIKMRKWKMILQKNNQTIMSANEKEKENKTKEEIISSQKHMGNKMLNIMRVGMCNRWR